MNIWIIIIGANIIVLWLCFLLVILIRIRFKIFEKKMIENTQNFFNKFEGVNKEANTMDKDLVKLGKYLVNKMQEMEERIVDEIDAISVDNDSEEDEDMEDELELDSNEDDFEYKGTRSVKDVPEPPKPEKKSLFGKKKKKGE